MENSGSINILEKIRLSRGNDLLRPFFKDMVKKNRRVSINALNDEELHFATLYILRPEVKQQHIFNNLSKRNQAALNLIEEITKADEGQTDYSPCCDFPREVLDWIFITGCYDDGLTDEYDRVMDITSILLIKMHNEKSILPMISEMIFKRNRKNFCNNDLIWVFFEASDLLSIELMAEHLKSRNQRDIELVSNILSFIPGLNHYTSISGDKKYAIFKDWYEENKPYLYYTGETMQQTTHPKFFDICLDGKYLSKNICVDTGKIKDTLSEDEGRLLGIFNKLDYSTKVMLAHYSCMLRKNDLNRWGIWIKLSMAKQVKIAQRGEFDA